MLAITNNELSRHETIDADFLACVFENNILYKLNCWLHIPYRTLTLQVSDCQVVHVLQATKMANVGVEALLTWVGCLFMSVLFEILT